MAPQPATERAAAFSATQVFTNAPVRASQTSTSIPVEIDVRRVPQDLREAALASRAMTASIADWRVCLPRHPISVTTSVLRTRSRRAGPAANGARAPQTELLCAPRRASVIFAAISGTTDVAINVWQTVRRTRAERAVRRVLRVPPIPVRRAYNPQPEAVSVVHGSAWPVPIVVPWAAANAYRPTIRSGVVRLAACAAPRIHCAEACVRPAAFASPIAFRVVEGRV
jgi:hypothetical protein